MKIFNKRIGLFLIILLGVFDFSIPINNQNVNGQIVNARTFRSLKGACKNWEQALKSFKIKRIEVQTREIQRISRTADRLERKSRSLQNYSKIKLPEMVRPEIKNYLKQIGFREGSVKIFTYSKTDAEQIRNNLQEQCCPHPLHIGLNTSDGPINVSEYDIAAMRENHFIGDDNLEYVQFVIPKKPTYVLEGNYTDNVFECKIFNIPKDKHGNWRKFKEYVVRFFEDLLNRPEQLWDEIMFVRGLKKINIDSRDVVEMKQYMFANVLYPNSKFNDEPFKSIKYIQQEVA